VPFCASLCAYCHFQRTDRHDPVLRRRYVDAVRREFDLRAAACASLAGGARRAATGYVGGGTPSCLEPDLFARLLEGTWGRLPRDDGAEVTAEANPESLGADLAAAWRDAGVNRISLGVQSLDPGVLAVLGRACGPDEARTALRLASRTFARVSADWILAPGCRADRLRAEFAEARDLGVGHVSLYILELHEGTALAADVAAGRVRRPPDAETERLYLAAREDLAALGYEQYEVSNFCLPGEESRHNGAYWRRVPYLGLGAGAHGFWGRRRYANHGDLDTYLAAVEGGRPPEAEAETLDREARRLERIVLPLRTCEGVPLAELPADEAWLARGVRDGLWRLEAGRLRLSGRGLLRIDAVEEALARRLGPGRGLPPPG
jgi:oxygen-independent coproporphyrinogen-3 oxidase